MKDKELREEMEDRLKDTNMRLGWLKEDVGEMKAADLDVLIKGCKKCGHDTLHERHLKPLYYVNVGSNGEKQTETFHRCLNCGTDWVYSEETVVTKYKPPKGD